MDIETQSPGTIRAWQRLLKRAGKGIEQYSCHPGKLDKEGLLAIETNTWSHTTDSKGC